MSESFFKHLKISFKPFKRLSCRNIADILYRNCFNIMDSELSMLSEVVKSGSCFLRKEINFSKVPVRGKTGLSFYLG